MLSYRHEYHAGNHADLLKHYCLFESLRYFASKKKAFSYFDTHAGAGVYSLDSQKALKNAEYMTGISRLMNSLIEMPVSLLDFKRFLRPFWQKGIYPSALVMALFYLPRNFYVHACELHRQDYLSLLNYMHKSSHAHKIYQQDGFSQLLTFLPPQPRRSIILIDPSYELKDDYQRVIGTLYQANQKFTTGCYLLWYPKLKNKSLDVWISELSKINPRYLQVEISFPLSKERGMYGSGMWLINPVYSLQTSLPEVLPILANLIGKDKAHYRIKSGTL